MDNLLIIVSSVLSLFSYTVYIVAILKGKAKPHRVTRFVIFIITLLATASLFAQGNTVAIWLSGSFALGSILIFLLSIKFGIGGRSKTDIICLVIALVGIVLWKITNDASVALYASIISDFVSQVPMLIKTFKFPETEVWTFYALSVFSAILNVFAIHQWIVVNIVFPFYIIFIDLFIVLLILRPRFLRILRK